jgi:hypothetical protein
VVRREAGIGALPGRFSPGAGGVSPMLCARTPVSIALFFLFRGLHDVQGFQFSQDFSSNQGDGGTVSTWS